MDSGSHESLLVRFRRFTRLDQLPTGIRRLIVGVIGGTILLIGLALVFLPGPAVLVIPLGLAILATEFAWARSYKERFEAKWADLRNRRQKPT